MRFTQMEDKSNEGHTISASINFDFVDDYGIITAT